MSKCARNDEMNFILILKGKLSAPYRVYRVCLPVSGTKSTQTKKRRRQKSTKKQKAAMQRGCRAICREKMKMKRVKMSTLSSVAFVDCVCV